MDIHNQVLSHSDEDLNRYQKKQIWRARLVGATATLAMPLVSYYVGAAINKEPIYQWVQDILPEANPEDIVFAAWLGIGVSIYCGFYWLGRKGVKHFSDLANLAESVKKIGQPLSKGHSAENVPEPSF